MGLGQSPRNLAEFPGAPGTKELFGEPEGRGVAAHWPLRRPAPRALPTSPSLPTGHASLHLSLQCFLELPGQEVNQQFMLLPLPGVPFP